MRTLSPVFWALCLTGLPGGTALGGNVVVNGNIEQRPVDPVLVGSLTIGSDPISVYVSGRYAYVVDRDAGELKVLDVSVPGAPALTGILAIGTLPLNVYKSGRYAYVVDAGSHDLKVIDVSDPTTPVLAGSLAILTSPRSVYVSGRYAYLVDQGSNDLKVIDVSDPGAPSLAGSLAVGANPISVFVSGRYAYVVDLGSDDLKVIDVSDPGAPILAGDLSLGSGPHSVQVSGRYAYVVDVGSNDLKVIDVSDPSAPSLAGSLTLGSVPYSVCVSGRYAYVVDDGSDDLKVIDVSDATAPVLAGSLANLTAPRSVYVSGRYAYVVDAGSNDLKVIDVSGSETTGLMAHSLEAGNLQVRDDLFAQGQLQVTGGVSVGAGGLFSDGDAGFAQNVDVIGDLTVAGSCSGCASDIRLKRNIRPLDGALDEISRLRAVSWDWREDAREARYDPGRQLGVLGEEVAAVFPELVGTDSRGYRFVRYPQLVAPLIEAVKELQREHAGLRADQDELQRAREDLVRRLERLEGHLE